MTVALRPMTIGEILDRTFNVYRQNFKMFVAIGMVPAFFFFVANAIWVLMTTAQPRSHNGFSTSAVVISLLAGLAILVVYVCASAITQGAVSYAVSAIHLGRSTSFSESYSRIKGKYLRILNVVISVGIRIGGTVLLVIAAGFAFVFMPTIRNNAALGAVMVIVWLIAFVLVGWFVLRMTARYSLAVPASVLEDLPARKAIKRSVALSKGSILRILTVYVLFSVVNGAFAFAVAIPFQIALVAAKAQLARVIILLSNQLASSVVAAIVGPLITIAITLIYYDERVRKEAFDVHYMMELLDGPAPEQANSAAASAGPFPA
jgi:hypothetical protein